MGASKQKQPKVKSPTFVISTFPYTATKDIRVIQYDVVALVLNSAVITVDGLGLGGKRIFSIGVANFSGSISEASPNTTGTPTQIDIGTAVWSLAASVWCFPIPFIVPAGYQINNAQGVPLLAELL